MLSKRILHCVSRRQMGTSAKEAQEAIKYTEMKKERLIRKKNFLHIFRLVISTFLLTFDL